MCGPKTGVALALALCCALKAELRVASKVESAAQLESGVELRLDNGGLMRIEMLEFGTTRVRLSRDGEFREKPSGAIAAMPAGERIDYQEDESTIVLRSTTATVTVAKNPMRMSITRTADGSMVVQDIEEGTAWDSDSGLIFTRKAAPDGEAYFGLGARGGPVNRRGRRIVMNNVDRDAYGEFTDPLYISVPFFYGAKDAQAWGVFLDNPATPFFDLDSEKKGEILFGATAGELDYYVFSGPATWTVANSYARLTGFTPLPPKWALGFHQSRYGYKSQAEFLALAERLRREKFPCDVLWFDIDYMDRKRNFTWDAAAFPDPAAMNRQLAAQGFRSINIVEPLFTIQDPNWYLLDLLGYLLKNPDGTSNVSRIWYGSVGFLDFTLTSAREWYKSQLSSFMRDYGVSGIWQDLNEPAQNYFPYVQYNFDGVPRPDSEARNVYALHMAMATSEAMRALKPMERPWAISRSGFSGVQRYAANWSGDTLSTFDSLRVSLQMTLSMGVSGQNFFGHDIGGFLGSPSYELYQRWLEFGSLIPLFRSHATNTTEAREPWSFGEQEAQRIRETISFRYQLLPYLYTVFKEASDTGLPVISPLWFYDLGDSGTYDEDTSFLLGRDLLVAPVIAEGARSREVYLPRGSDWVEFHSKNVYSGGQMVNVDAPLGTVPMFVRAGAILPLGPVVQHTGEPAAQGLMLHVFPGGDGDAESDVYEDDGVSINYLAGQSTRTQYKSIKVQEYRALFGQRLGHGYALPERGLTVLYYGVAQAPARVEMNGAVLARASSQSNLPASGSGWWYDAASRTLTVQGKDSDTLQLFVLY